MNSFVKKSAGFTLVEAMISMAIGMFLVLGAVTVYTEGRYSFQVTEGTTIVQENLRFAMETMEPDIRLAGYWGMHTDSGLIQEDAMIITCDGADVTTWALDSYVGITARNNITAGNTANVAAGSRTPVNCGAFDLGIAENTDVLEIRRSSAGTRPLAAGTVQIKSNRNNSRIFNNGVEPAGFVNQPDIDGTYDYVFNTYYVSQTSDNVPNTPSLRRRTLNGLEVVDEEIIAGVEDMQIQFGIDANGDGSVNRYINPDAAGFDADSNIIAVRLWLLMRSEYIELGHTDNRTYTTPEGIDYVPADSFRRLEGSKTIYLRNRSI